MLVYLMMLALILFVLQFSTLQKDYVGGKIESVKKPKPLSIWIVFIIFSFVAAFRYGVGTDFYSYYKNNNWINRFEEGNYSDPGFTVFSIVCDFLFRGQKGAITIGAAIVTVALFVFTIVKRSESISISIFLFIFAGCFLGMFNGVRQYLATAILFAGYRFVVDKKPIKWLLVVLLAASIHITAILMFFIYFLCNLKCDWKRVFIYFVLATILLFAYEPLFNLVGALKQDTIDTSDVYMSGTVNRLRIVVQFVPMVMLVFLDKRKLNEDKEARFLFNISLLNGALAIAAMNSPYLSRFWIYTSCFQILMYPSIFSKMKKDNKFLFTILLLIFYAMFWVYEVMNSASLSTFQWIFKYI